MTTATKPNMIKRTSRTARRAAVQHISDRRYYVQCAYRVTMAIIALVSLIIVTANH